MVLDRAELEMCLSRQDIALCRVGEIHLSKRILICMIRRDSSQQLSSTPSRIRRRILLRDFSLKNCSGT